MICENCKTEHDGSYGSGRFCSSKCARGFSTKAKRKEINEKVSKTKSKPLIIKTCEICKKEFKVKNRYKSQLYCSRSCSSKARTSSNEYKKWASNHFSKLALKRHECNDPGIGWKSRINRKPSYPEKVTIDFLDYNNLNYIREYPVGKYNIDFAFIEKKIALEIDGRQHLKRIEYDIKRDIFLNKNSWTVIRIQWLNDKQHWNRIAEQLEKYKILKKRVQFSS